MVKQKNTKEMRSTATTAVYNPKAAPQGMLFYRVPQGLDAYQWIDGYTHELSMLYAIIANWYNAKEGYAYPTQHQIMMKYNKSINVLRIHIQKLVKVGLISVESAGTGKNHRYVPHVPMSQDRLFEKFPCAAANYEKKMKWIEEREWKGREGLRELHERLNKSAETAETPGEDLSDMQF
ncbi:hypothetical protein B5P41_18450 [Bacillus sp. SRB_28]|nr:hypothetical protein B5P41_18450 [Bacillus sp. SRB_28]